MRISFRKLLTFMIAVIMLVPIITVSLVASAAGQKTFTLDVVSDFELMPTALKGVGEAEKCGTDNYFTIYYDDSTVITSTSNKLFSDGYNPTKRIDFKDKTTISSASVSAAIGFRTTSPSTVKVWWSCGGDGRKAAIFDSAGKEIARETRTTIKNEVYYTEFNVDAGAYYYGNTDGSNYLFKIEIVESDYSNTSTTAAWDDIAVPQIVSAQYLAEGEIDIKVNAMVGNVDNVIYADRVTITVEGGNVHNSESFTSAGDGKTFSCKLSPSSSGKYKVYATIEREGMEPKVSEPVEVDYILPLVAPYLSSATSKGISNGKGTVEIEYTAAPEAEEYIIYVNNKKVGTTTETKYTVEDLDIGKLYYFKVAAVRGSEIAKSAAISATTTIDAKPTWAFTYYGPSTGENNGYSGSINEKGYVTVYSEKGKGKIVPASVDGLSFYYTKIPTDQNFTLRATVTVDSWTFSNGQEGFGIMVADRLGVAGDKSDFWNNQYMAGTTKIEYKYEADEDGNVYVYDNSSYSGGTKYTMKLGLGVVAKTGVNKDNLADISVGKTDVINRDFRSVVLPLETGAGGFDAGTYNAIGKYTNTEEAFIETNLPKLLETFILEIERNNTGYFIRYYDVNEKLIRELKNYDPEALDQLDSEYVYAGFYAARNARATFSDVKLTTIDPALDAPAEPRPITYVTPAVTVTSPTNTTSGEYKFAINTNVDGIIKIKDSNTGDVLEEKAIKRETRLYIDFNLENGYNIYEFTVELDPDDDQDLGEYTELINNYNVNVSHTVTYRAGNYHRKTVYISPTGSLYGTGSREEPFDIATAINSAVPGQTLVLMEGVYEFETGFKIERGNNGTEENPIRLIADPEANTRPVLDFMNLGTGLTHGGDWWIFEGFDVTRSANGQKGFQISGNHNVLVNIHAYRNGNTGIQISRYVDTDYEIEDWPSYNLVLNCLSYYNMDAGHEDADGFAAKLTVGPGNVFDGCVAHDNADDGWDLYAKVQTGAIGSVTIKNCVAYHNGYIEDGTASKGNGNGFKMGGESIPGNHVLINSIAFDNRMKGIDSNSCPDIQVYNSISFNNGGSNVAFYTNREQDTNFIAQGVISISTKADAAADKLSARGAQLDDLSGYLNATNFYWSGGICTNSEGQNLKAEDIFVSLEFDYEAGVQRNADGTINLGDFLKLKDGAVPKGVGTTGDSTPSPVLELVPDLEHNYSDEWYNLDVNKHWQQCECGDKINVGNHTFEWIIDKEPTDREYGYKHQECTVCGYKRVRISIDPTGTGTNPPSSEPITPPVDNTTDEPSGFFEMIKAFFQQIIEWFKNLFGGSKD